MSEPTLEGLMPEALRLRYPVHEKVVRAALDELARHVHEVPMGSNSGPRVREYQACTWLGGTGWPWCVAYWQWCVKQAGFKMPYLGAGAYALGQWARDNHWSRSLAYAVPGDALVIREGAGHLAVYLSHSGGTVHTVNGNWGDAVALVDFPVSVVETVVHLPERGIVTPPVRPPMWEVVTSASGHSKVVFVGTRNAVARALAALFKRWGGITIRRHKGGT